MEPRRYILTRAIAPGSESLRAACDSIPGVKVLWAREPTMIVVEMTDDTAEELQQRYPEIRVEADRQGGRSSH